MSARSRVLLSAGLLRIPLRTTFRHAAAERACGESLLVRATGPGGMHGFGEGCPRPYVSGETPKSCAAFFRRHRASLQDAITDVEALNTWVTRQVLEIDANPAAWCALELALLDLLGHTSDRSLEAMLGLPAIAGRFRYTAVLGDAELPVFEKQLARYIAAGFSDYKLKLSGDLTRDRERIHALSDVARTVRVDANNLWTDPDTAIRHVDSLDLPLAGVEEPLRPAGRIDDLARLADTVRAPVILDESVLRIGQLDKLAGLPHRWVVNLRLSKMGGPLRSLALLERGLGLGLRFVIGAQVGETSLLTRAALPVAAAAGDALAGQEGAFGSLLLEHDPCTPELQFGLSGELRAEDVLAPDAPGLGLAVETPASWLEPLN